MELQTVIVALIILASMLYVGNLLRLKIKAFKPKTDSCGASCGCEKASKRETLRNKKISR